MICCLVIGQYNAVVQIGSMLKDTSMCFVKKKEIIVCDMMSMMQV
jgi:hypothetical protein